MSFKRGFVEFLAKIWIKLFQSETTLNLNRISRWGLLMFLFISVSISPCLSLPLSLFLSLFQEIMFVYSLEFGHSLQKHIWQRERKLRQQTKMSYHMAYSQQGSVFLILLLIVGCAAATSTTTITTASTLPSTHIDVSKLNRSNFPANFLFGTASAAYQVRN